MLQSKPPRPLKCSGRFTPRCPTPKDYHRQMIRWISLFTALTCLAQEPIAPHSAFEPPAAKAAASLAASTKDSPRDLLTTGEKTDWSETAPYAEAIDIAHRLEHASRFVK